MSSTMNMRELKTKRRQITKLTGWCNVNETWKRLASNSVYSPACQRDKLCIGLW